MAQVIADGEIVGLKCGDRGRSCSEHEICGSSVEVGDVFVIRFTMMLSPNQEGVFEEALRVVKLDGTAMETCTIGFLPRACLRYDREKYIDKFGVITEKYENSGNIEIRR